MPLRFMLLAALAASASSVASRPSEATWITARHDAGASSSSVTSSPTTSRSELLHVTKELCRVERDGLAIVRPGQGLEALEVEPQPDACLLDLAEQALGALWVACVNRPLARSQLPMITMRWLLRSWETLSASRRTAAMARSRSMAPPGLSADVGQLGRLRVGGHTTPLHGVSALATNPCLPNLGPCGSTTRKRI